MIKPLTIVKFDIGGQEVVDHILRYCLVFDMFEQNFHRRVVRETAILLFKSEV